jgi:hypothetical protein
MFREKITRDAIARLVLRILAVYGIVIAAIVGLLNFAAGNPNPDQRAIVAMGLGLIVIWCVLGGIAMRLIRDRFVELVRRLKIDWRLVFVLLCIIMAMLEEAVTTSLTNAAPLFGAATEAARITSSKNYLEVISGSVVMFIPWFICWAWLLGRYDFHSAEVMLLFGLTGTLAESLTFGWPHIAEVGMWTYVYGLMVYLPAHAVPDNRNVRPARWYHYVVAVPLPLVFIIPLAAWVLVSSAKCAISVFRKHKTQIQETSD